MERFIIPDKYVFSINEVAEILKRDEKTIWHNTSRTPGEHHYLKAFKISPGNIRIKNKDLAEYILRVFEQDIQVPNFQFVNVPLTTKQIAYLLNCYVDTAITIKGKEEVTFEDLESFISRSYIMEPEIR